MTACEIEGLLKRGTLNELRTLIAERAVPPDAPCSDGFWHLVSDVLEASFKRGYESGRHDAAQEFLERSAVEPAASWGH